MPLPHFTYDQIARHLTDTGQEYFDDTRQSFNVAPGGSITVHYEYLNSGGQAFAELALQAWSNVTGINFIAIDDSTTANIFFGHGSSGDGAFSAADVSNGIIAFAEITISEDLIEDDWSEANGIQFDSYSLQTFIHEIGHALGLAHAGNYNNVATYPNDALYSNDSWQASVMSYFNQSENTAINADYAYAVTPMIADIIAIHDLYGTPNTIHLGNTVYGSNSTAGGYLDDLQYASNPVAFTIYDNGGIDTIDVSGYSGNQTINLHQEAISSIGGISGNMIIARGVDIENANGGGGNDHIFGNALNNRIYGYGGNDNLYGGTGNDRLNGGSGDDLMRGGLDNDLLLGRSGVDVLAGGAGDDRLYGGSSADKLYGGAGNDQLNGGSGDDLMRGGLDDDRLKGNNGDDNMNGEAGNDWLSGGDGADWVEGGRGNDILRGDDGNDILLGRSGVDVLSGGSGNDRFYGGSSDDRLYGGAGDDNLNGGSGDDLLYGGAGSDSLKGNSGADTFVFKTISGTDTVQDFTDGADLILYKGGSFADLTIVADGANVDITATDGGHFVLLNTDLLLISEDDFIFGS